MTDPRFVLASASPRRREMLERIGAPFIVRVSQIDESPLPAETPENYVVRLALEKARDIAKSEKLPVLAADTVVAIDGKLLGKPENDDRAISMLRQLQGRTHVVVTGVALISNGREESFSTSTSVSMRPLNDAEIKVYVQTGEPLDKAGAYAIQGVAASFVSAISGSYTNIVGLPLAEVVELLVEKKVWSPK